MHQQDQGPSRERERERERAREREKERESPNEWLPRKQQDGHCSCLCLASVVKRFSLTSKSCFDLTGCSMQSVCNFTVASAEGAVIPCSILILTGLSAARRVELLFLSQGQGGEARPGSPLVTTLESNSCTTVLSVVVSCGALDASGGMQTPRCSRYARDNAGARSFPFPMQEKIAA